MNEDMKRKREKAMREYLFNQTDEGWDKFQTAMSVHLGGLEVTLHEKNDDVENPRKVKVVIGGDSHFLYVSPVGYGEMTAVNGHGNTVFLELYDDELRLVYSSDINSEDQEIVSLEGAREDKRNDDDE